MKITRTTTLKIIRGGGLALLGIIIVIYAISRSLTYAHGPHIIIIQPADGASIASSTVTIVGQVQRAHDLTLNGNPIAIDEQGNFKEILIIFPGINTITLRADDQFGRNTQITRTLVGVAN